MDRKTLQLFIRRIADKYVVEDIHDRKIGDPSPDLLVVDKGLTAASEGAGKKVIRYLDLSWWGEE